MKLRDRPSDKALPLSVGAALSGALHAEVVSDDDEKCPRCWAYSDAVGKGSKVCLNCREALAA